MQRILTIPIDQNYEYRWSVDGNKYGTNYDKTIPNGFSDKKLVDDGWEEVLAVNGSLFYEYGGATYAEGLEKSRGVNNQEVYMTSVSKFANVMAVGFRYDGSIVFDKQSEIEKHLDEYYGAVTGAFGILKDGAKCEWGKELGRGQYTGLSGRTVIGFDSNTNSYKVLTVSGVTGKSGLTGAQLYELCLNNGFTDAICFDGGGSVFCRYLGQYVNNTTRKVKNAIILYRRKKTNSDNTEEEQKEDEGMAIKIIDVSYYQNPIDYQKVKDSGVKGVILRCGYTGYGVSKSKQADACFEKHYKGFRAVGMPVGVYYYSCAVSTTEAKEEAKLVLNLIKGKQIDYPVYFDTEDNHNLSQSGVSPTSQYSIGKAKLTEVAKAFLEVIENAGYYAGIYASTSWLNNQLDMAKLKNYDVWVAQYASKCTYKGNYGMWQYSSSGSVNGISGRVDMNHCYKDYPTIIKNAGLNGYGKPQEEKPTDEVTELKAQVTSLKAQLEKANNTIKSKEEEITLNKSEVDRLKKKVNDARAILNK